MTTNQSYQAAVSEARTLVKRSEEDQWRLAQLTWVNSASHGSGGKKTIGQWAQDIGVDDSYASRLWTMWDENRTRSEMETRPPFSKAYKEVSPHSSYQPQLHNQSVPDQARAVQQALRNPDVSRQVFADPDTKSMAITTIHHSNTEHEPKHAPSVSRPTMMGLLAELAEAKRRVRWAFKASVALDPDNRQKDELLDALGEIETEVEQYRKFLAGMGVDEALSKIMEGA